MKKASRPSPSQSTRLVWRSRGSGMQPERQPRREHDHDVQPEIHAPSGVMGDGAAHQRPNAEAEHQEARPRADRPRALQFRDRLRHRGKRASDRERRADPLQRACADNHGSVHGNGDGQRGESERRDSDCGRAPRPELVRRLAAQNDEYGGGEQVGVDDPFHRRRAQAQLARHRRQRGHDRRAVFADRQHRQATGDQHEAGIARA